MAPTDFDCSNIFPFPVVNELGKENYCFWKTSCELHACIGSESTIKPGDFISLQPTITSSSGSYLQYKLYKIEAEIIPSPIALLKIKTPIEYYDNLLLDGSYSMPLAGNGLQYIWNLVNESESGQSEVIKKYLDSSSPKISIPTNLFSTNYTYEFQLQVVNYFGRKSNSIVGVYKKNPQNSICAHFITIQGPNEIFEFDVSQTTNFYADIEKNYTEKEIRLKWTILDIKENTIILNVTQNSTLHLPTNFLQPYNQYEVNLYSGDEIIEQSAKLLIHTIPGKICASIYGGKYQWHVKYKLNYFLQVTEMLEPIVH